MQQIQQLKAQNLKSTQNVMKAGIAEDYKAACDSSGSWVACAIYAAYIEDSDQKNISKILREGMQFG